MTAWPLPSAAHGFPAGSMSLLYCTLCQDCLHPLNLPGLPKKSVKDNHKHNLHGTPGATGKGTEYTWTADVSDTT